MPNFQIESDNIVTVDFSRIPLLQFPARSFQISDKFRASQAKWRPSRAKNSLSSHKFSSQVSVSHESSCWGRFAVKAQEDHPVRVPSHLQVSGRELSQVVPWRHQTAEVWLPEFGPVRLQSPTGAQDLGDQFQKFSPRHQTLQGEFSVYYFVLTKTCCRTQSWICPVRRKRTSPPRVQRSCQRTLCSRLSYRRSAREGLW